jgi:anaerobic selenocysteine-containing dehydrogenase
VFQLGGNLVRSLPDVDRLVPAWRKLRLTVQIETKLNRSCLVHGDVSYILPCLGRTEIDEQHGREQAVSVEDSTACIHGSRGYAVPASAELRSEPWIIAARAKAILPVNPKVAWDDWVAEYGRVRDAIERTYPEMFEDFNKRMWQPGGFHRPLAACHREWKTKSGKANFIAPQTLASVSKLIRHATMFFNSRRFAARDSSTRRSTRTATGSGAFVAREWCFS